MISTLVAPQILKKEQRKTLRPRRRGLITSLEYTACGSFALNIQNSVRYFWRFVCGAEQLAGVTVQGTSKPHKAGQFMKSGRGKGCEHVSATKRSRARTSLTACMFYDILPLPVRSIDIIRCCLPSGSLCFHTVSSWRRKIQVYTRFF